MASVWTSRNRIGVSWTREGVKSRKHRRSRVERTARVGNGYHYRTFLIEKGRHELVQHTFALTRRAFPDGYGIVESTETRWFEFTIEHARRFLHLARVRGTEAGRRGTLIAPLQASLRILRAIASIDRVGAQTADARQIDRADVLVEALARLRAWIASEKIRDGIMIAAVAVGLALRSHGFLVVDSEIERFIRRGEIDEFASTIVGFARSKRDVA